MVTLKEIAERTGLAESTVSRVLNGDTSLSIADARRRLVVETAESLNYVTRRERQNAKRRELRDLRQPPARQTVALVHFLDAATELSRPYYVGLRRGIEQRCEEYGIEARRVFAEDGFSLASVPEATAIIAVGPHRDALLKALAMLNMPMVVADHSPWSEAFDCVDADVERGAYRLCDVLGASGGRRFAYIGWPEDPDPSARPGRRLRAIQTWLREIDRYDASLVRLGEMSPEGSYAAAMELLDVPSGERPDALIVGTDLMAVGVYRAAAELGLVIPDDVSVVGFNDSSVAQILSPKLTSISIPAGIIGETAVDLIVERLLGRTIAKRIIVLTKLVWRDSCRPTPDGQMPGPRVLSAKAGDA